MAEALSKEAYALLEAIAKSESAGAWNVIYGGSTFEDYSKHPAKYVTIKSGPNKGKDVSSAAGKFQITKSTYDLVAPRLGITDFSPESQLRIAWYLAKDAYGPNLERDLKNGDPATIAKVGKKLNDVWTSLPVGIEQGQTSNEFVKNFTRAVETRAGMVPPGMLGDDPQFIKEGIQDRNAARLGYGEIAPQPLSRPNSFNETGAPPIPLQRPPKPPSLAEQTGVQPLDPNMSPALQAARQRLTAARLAKTGVTTPEAMAATPRITDTDAEVVTRRPALDWGQFRPGVTVGGAGSLFEGPSPATPNPPKPPVSGLRLPASPTTVAGRPEAPIGSIPAAKPKPSIVKTGQGLAGTAELPADYRPPAGIIPTAKTGNTLVAGRHQAPVGALPAAKPIATSIVNPEYTAWVKKYGTGRVNPAAVESLEDIHDRQASALGYGAIPPVPQNRPPAPPKMITVAKPGNTVSRPSAPAQAAPAKPATTIVQIGGYLYDSSQKAANGGLLKVGKVGSSSSSSSGAGNTLTVAPRPSTSTTTVKPAAPSTSTGRGITGNSSFASWAFG